MCIDETYSSKKYLNKQNSFCLYGLSIDNESILFMILITLNLTKRRNIEKRKNDEIKQNNCY